MQQSVLLCISTILDSGNHYTKMMELVDGTQACIKLPCQQLSVPLLTDLGFKVFETINITLVRTTILCQNVYRSHTFCPRIVMQVCDDCLKGDFPERCRHKLASMPRWLSSKKVEVVRQLLAEVRTTIPCQHVSKLTCGGVLWCRTPRCCAS